MTGPEMQVFFFFFFFFGRKKKKNSCVTYLAIVSSITMTERKRY